MKFILWQWNRLEIFEIQILLKLGGKRVKMNIDFSPVRCKNVVVLIFITLEVLLNIQAFEELRALGNRVFLACE